MGRISTLGIYISDRKHHFLNIISLQNHITHCININSIDYKYCPHSNWYMTSKARNPFWGELSSLKQKGSQFWNSFRGTSQAAWYAAHIPQEKKNQIHHWDTHAITRNASHSLTSIWEEKVSNMTDENNTQLDVAMSLVGQCWTINYSIFRIILKSTVSTDLHTE